MSYAHRDKDVTSAIQKGLHQIGRRVGQLRALRVFRDDTNLTANPDLWAKITEALDGSRFMIVVLSPQSAASHWVNEEVKYWLEHRGHEQLMLVLAEGHLQWNATEARFNPEQSDAAPPVLTEPGSLPAEPLYIDVSGDAPWELGSLVFRDKVTSLAAPVHGKPKDDLTGDDLREQRRFRRLRRAAIAGLVALTVVAVVATVIAVVQRGEAIRQRQEAIREARDALAAQLETEAAAVFSRVTPNSDIHALADTLAAQRLRSDPSASRSAFYTATTALNTTRVIIPTPSSVGSVAFSPDGHTLAVGGADLRLWDLSDPAHPVPLGRLLNGQTNGVGSVAFSPDGHTLATGGSDLRLWDLTDAAHPVPRGQPLTVHVNGVVSIAFSPDGHTLATGGRDGSVQWWNLSDPAHPASLGQSLTSHTNGVISAAFGPGGHTLATGSLDGEVRVWDLTDPAHLEPLGQSLTGHTSAVESVAFSPDGHTLATGSGDETVRLWNLADPGSRTAGRAPDWPHQHRGECGVQPRRTHPGLRRRWHRAVVEPHRPRASEPLGQPLTGHTNPCCVWRSAPTGTPWPPPAPTTPPGCGTSTPHYPSGPRQRCGQCGVQPRRAHPGLR